MKLQNVVRVIVMLLIGLLVYISIGFGMILASKRSSVKITDRKILNEKPDNQLTARNVAETKFSESIIDQTIDF